MGLHAIQTASFHKNFHMNMLNVAFSYSSAAFKILKHITQTSMSSQHNTSWQFITFPVGAVAKYCNEHVCVCVYLYICPRAYLPNHMCDLYNFLCILLFAVAWSSSGRVTKSKGKGQFWKFSSPLTMHCTAQQLEPKNG